MDVPQENENSEIALKCRLRLLFDKLVQQPIELTNTTGTYLQHLNDDCLLEIFSVKSLTPLDLCSLAETCTRFKQMVERVFWKELQIQIDRCFVDYRVKSGNYEQVAQVAVYDVERIFKNFGSTLSAISILLSCYHPTKERSNFVLNLVATYCDDTLESFKIEHVKISAVLAVKLKPIFKRLQLLHITFGSIEGGKTLFAELDSLIELNVVDVENGSAVLENVFPKLERFTYEWEYGDINQSLPTFISRHPSLKTLYLWIECAEMNATDILQSIGDNCKDLRELSIYTGFARATSSLPLQALKSVKILKLRHAQCEDFSFVPAMTNLRELEFDECSLPDDSNQFALLTQITKLRVYDSESFDVVDIIKRLINLEELTVETYGGFVLDEETFSKIVNKVKGRPNVLTLKCRFNF